MSIIKTTASNWIHSLFQTNSSLWPILLDCSAEMHIGEHTNYNDFRLKGIDCDVVLESSEGVQFPAHRIVLRKQTYVSFCKNNFPLGKNLEIIPIVKLPCRSVLPPPPTPREAPPQRVSVWLGNWGGMGQGEA